MWEAIQANRRRSRLLIALMAAVLVGLGGIIGAALAGGADGALVGVGAALAVWVVLLILALSSGEQLVLAGAGARPIEKADAPRLWNVVEEMSIAAGLGTLPKIHVIDDDRPNAFAVGRRPETASVAVTSGLVKRLDRDELQGVLAHEIGHIRNQDTRFMTVALVMIGSVALLSDGFLRLLWYGGGRRRGGKGGGQAQLVLLAVAVVAAVLAPIAARLLYLACSRQREYLADASAARFTRYPQGLASALEKIATSARTLKGPRVFRAMAPLYIVNPLAPAATGHLLSTHPPTARRVRILREMAGTAGWVDYEKAYRTVTGTGCLDDATLAVEGSVAARAPLPIAEPRQEAVERSREVTDLLDRMVDVLVLACVCGLRIKVPPEYDGKELSCSRCGRRHAVPRAQVQEALVAAAGATSAVRGADRPDGAGGAGAASPAPLVFHRKNDGWQAFRCACGKTLQVSPALRVSTVRCKKCRRRIEIRDASG